MERLENGNTLILMEKQVRVPEISKEPIAENFIIEVNPQGEIVWEWYTTEHFDEFGYSDEAKRLMYQRGRDIFHTNTLSVLPANELEKVDSRFAKGNILIFDNGQAGYPPRVRFYTRLIEINPLTGEIVWQYAHEPNYFKPTCKFFSPSWGSVQRLPNGNTFSLDPHKGRIFEVTPWGEIVWEYINPFTWGGERWWSNRGYTGPIDTATTRFRRPIRITN